MTWKPIDSAPRNGEILDLWCVCPLSGNEYRVPDCSWVHHNWLNGEPDGPKTWWDRDRFYISPRPTHWMHRPKGPAT